MNHSAPHFRLFSESNAEDQPGRWRFRLQPKRKGYLFRDNCPTTDTFEAGGTEPDVRGERLDLLCVVRGLEALDQPSQVTLITSSAYVREGIRYGLQQWRANGWRWESFGRMVPVKNQDLWQRVDAALQFHRLECQVWRFDEAHNGPPRASSSEDSRVETGSAIRVMPEPPPAWSEGRDISRYSLWSCAMMRWLVGLRLWILDGAAQVGRAVRV